MFERSAQADEIVHNGMKVNRSEKLQIKPINNEADAQERLRVKMLARWTNYTFI